MELLEADSSSLSVDFFSSCTVVGLISAWTGVDFIPGAVLISDFTGVDFSFCLKFLNQIWTCLGSSPIELPISCLVLKSGKLVSLYSSLRTIFCFSVKWLYFLNLCFLNLVAGLVKDSDMLSSSCLPLESGSWDNAELVLLFLGLLEADSSSLSVVVFSSCTGADLISDLTGVDFSFCLRFWNQNWTWLTSRPVSFPIFLRRCKSANLDWE